MLRAGELWGRDLSALQDLNAGAKPSNTDRLRRATRMRKLSVSGRREALMIHEHLHLAAPPVNTHFVFVRFRSKRRIRSTSKRESRSRSKSTSKIKSSSRSKSSSKLHQKWQHIQHPS